MLHLVSSMLLSLALFPQSLYFNSLTQAIILVLSVGHLQSLDLVLQEVILFLQVLVFVLQDAFDVFIVALGGLANL